MAFEFSRRSKEHPPKMGAKAYPLRKIVGHKMVEMTLAGGKPSGVSIEHEELECGHTMRPRSDFVGETNANKRRCLQCYREARAALAKAEAPNE